jgi:hypothetical protein
MGFMKSEKNKWKITHFELHFRTALDSAGLTEITKWLGNTWLTLVEQVRPETNHKKV